MMKIRNLKFFIIVLLICFLTLSSIKIIDKVQAQNYSNHEINQTRTEIEKNIINTVWGGTYKVGSEVFDTHLIIVIVSSGYIGGRIIHEGNEGNKAMLRAKIAGDILFQYLVDLRANGSFEWVDEDGITPEQLSKIPIKDKRQLIRLKRFRGLEYKDTSNNYWNTNREYRLLLKNNTLTGVVGTPLQSYGSNDGISEEGTLLLKKMKIIKII